MKRKRSFAFALTFAFQTAFCWAAALAECGLIDIPFDSTLVEYQEHLDNMGIETVVHDSGVLSLPHDELITLWGENARFQIQILDVLPEINMSFPDAWFCEKFYTVEELESAKENAIQIYLNLLGNIAKSYGPPTTGCIESFFDEARYYRYPDEAKVKQTLEQACDEAIYLLCKIVTGNICCNFIQKQSGSGFEISVTVVFYSHENGMLSINADPNDSNDEYPLKRERSFI